MKILYTAKATAAGGRAGSAKSDDGALNVSLAVPAELGGKGGQGTNPEQLFAAGYSACFLSAMQAVSGKLKVELPADTTVSAAVGIGPSGTGYGLDVELTATLPGLDEPTAQKVLQAAHEVCPYSNATRGNIDVRLKLG